MTTITGIAQKLLEENNYITDASSINVTAQNILDENNWTAADDITLTKTERLMDNAINYINLEANTNIPPTAGTAESKTVTLTRSESAAMKTLTALLIRAHLDKGPNIGVGSISVSGVISDPHYTLYADIVQKSISRLKTTNPIYVERLIDNAINLINLHAGISISSLSGTPGTKSLTATDKQIVVIKLVASGFLQKQASTGIGGFSITKTMESSIRKLRGSSIPFVVAEDTSGLT